MKELDQLSGIPRFIAFSWVRVLCGRYQRSRGCGRGRVWQSPADCARLPGPRVLSASGFVLRYMPTLRAVPLPGETQPLHDAEKIQSTALRRLLEEGIIARVTPPPVGLRLSGRPAGSTRPGTLTRLPRPVPRDATRASDSLVAGDGRAADGRWGTTDRRGPSIVGRWHLGPTGWRGTHSRVS